MTTLSSIITPTNIVTATSTTTMTNKTLTSPVINTGTLATPNITAGLTLTGAAGTSGQVLTSQGSGNAPVWSTPAAGTEIGLVRAISINCILP